ncbi:MAG: hypothetical protein NZM25_05955 [Leptospiraceae bacterium]|nr:hypothetical protein [Leptospiraceae bacterium]MDW8306681.1 helix-turn-helix domain-containing protein [Leptospiraceae bacterium]
MSRALKEALLGVFFSHGVQAALKLLQGKIEGVVFRQDLVRNLSDIALADSSHVPVEPIQDVENLLQVLERYGLIKDGQKVLPVLNTTFELEQFWGRADIVRACEAVPRISAWQVPRLERSRLEVKSSPEDVALKSQLLSEGKRQLEIKIERRRPELTHAPPMASSRDGESEKDQRTEMVGSLIQDDAHRSKLSERLRQEVEIGKLAVWALETLPYPILAVDFQGKELFHNKEWEALQLKNVSPVAPGDVYEAAKKVISRRAVEGRLEAGDVMEIPNFLAKHRIFFRAMRARSRVLGYLFWVLPEKEEPYIGREIQEKQEDFLGKTLPEILAEVEKKALLWAYEQADGNKSNAAMLLGIPRQTYGYRLKRYLGET